jgi:hypothetical protein
MQSLPDDLELPDILTDVPASRAPLKKSSTIKPSLKVPKAAADMESEVEPITSPLFEEDDVFWDSKTIIFVSWYWPLCILIGACLGVLLAVLL